MEVKVYKDMVSVADTVCDTKAEVPIETEILIPDYLPEVFKIVKCFVKPVVLQKHVSQSRFTVEGYMRCLIYYQTQGAQGLCQIEQKIPFQRQIELREGNYVSFDAFVTGETEYLNCRAVSGRRLDIRGAYVMSIRVCCEHEQEIYTAVSDCGMEQKTIPLAALKRLKIADKIVSVDESISFVSAPEVILDTACYGVVSEAKLIAGKAVVKGSIEAEVSYRTAGDANVMKATRQIPFNEILDIEGAAEDCQALVFVEPTGCTILAQQEGGSCSITVTAIITVRLFKACEYYAVVDAFSTQYETEVSHKELVTDELCDNFCIELTATAAGSLPQENMKIVDIRAQILPIELMEEDADTVLRGRVTAHIICENELGELECYDKTTEFTLPTRYKEQASRLQATCFAQIKSLSARKVGNDMEASILISVCGMVTKQNKTDIVEHIECKNERETLSSDIALHIYYAQEGENLFDIAKHYGASPAIIANSNDIEESVFTAKQQLLIPY